MEVVAAATLRLVASRVTDLGTPYAIVWAPPHAWGTQSSKHESAGTNNAATTIEHVPGV